MKAIRIFLTSVITLTLSSFCALAQMQRPPMPKGEGPQRKHLKLTPKERATQRTDEMHKAVRLDEKQYKKILSPEQHATWRRLHPDPSEFFTK